MTEFFRANQLEGEGRELVSRLGIEPRADGLRRLSVGCGVGMASRRFAQYRFIRRETALREAADVPVRFRRNWGVSRRYRMPTPSMTSLIRREVQERAAIGQPVPVPIPRDER